MSTIPNNQYLNLNNPTSTATKNPALSQLMAEFEFGPTSGIQLLFARFQLAQSQICKNLAHERIKEIEDIQGKQKRCSEIIQMARSQQANLAKNTDTNAMPEEVRSYFYSINIVPKVTNSNLGTVSKDDWDYNLKALTSYQEQIGSKVQTLIIYMQDYMGQYNAYLQGCNTSIANANQTLNSIARGQ